MAPRFRSLLSVDHTFGERIRDLRLVAGLTQQELAERVGLKTGQISGVERGERLPSLAAYRRIVNVFDLTAEAAGHLLQLVPIDGIPQKGKATAIEGDQAEGAELPEVSP